MLAFAPHPPVRKKGGGEGELQSLLFRKRGRLTISLVNIRPSIFPTHHILHLLPLHLLTLIIPPLNRELIRTSSAFEFILTAARRRRRRRRRSRVPVRSLLVVVVAPTHCQAIAAAWTDFCFWFWKIASAPLVAPFFLKKNRMKRKSKRKYSQKCEGGRGEGVGKGVYIHKTYREACFVTKG